MGSVLSSESITVDQLRALIGDLKAKDATVTIHVSAFHYEEYTVTTVENEEIPPEEGSVDRGEADEYKELHWASGSNGSHPEGAVRAGTDQGGVPIFVARARHQGCLIPGKLHPAHKTVYVAWGGVEHAKKRYEVLKEGPRLSWKAAANGHVPKNAVKGGHTAEGQPLYIIRAKVEGSDTVGKINLENKFGHVPFGGQEHIVKHYEVLVQHHHRHNHPSHAASPAPPRYRQKVRTEVKQKKVETFRMEHHLPLSSCFDLTGPTLEGWQPTVNHPVVILSLNLEVFPMDAESSERLDQYKRHLASEYANKDKILETKVTFTVPGQKTLVAGRDPITITAYDPRFEEEAKSGCCCFGRPGVKRMKVTLIKKFLTAPLHIFREGNGLSAPSVTSSYPSPLPPTTSSYHQQEASAPPLQAPAGQYVAPQATAGYPSQVHLINKKHALTLYPLQVKDYPPPVSSYSPATALGYPLAPQYPPASQYPPALQYPTTPQYPQAPQYPPASNNPPLASSETNQNWSHPPPYYKQ